MSEREEEYRKLLEELERGSTAYQDDMSRHCDTRYIAVANVVAEKFRRLEAKAVAVRIVTDLKADQESKADA